MEEIIFDERILKQSKKKCKIHFYCSSETIVLLKKSAKQKNKSFSSIADEILLKNLKERE